MVLLSKDKGNLLPAYKQRDFYEGSTDRETEKGLYFYDCSARIMLKFLTQPEQELYP